MKNKITHTYPIPIVIPRLIVGLVFLSEGLQKFIIPELLGAGRFAKIGFTNPEFWANFTGTFEIICGCLVILGLLIRLVSIPLLIIMIVAFITTKYPILVDKDFWTMAHEYRTDFAMTMLLIYFLIHGSGKFSFDYKMYNSQ